MLKLLHDSSCWALCNSDMTTVGSHHQKTCLHHLQTIKISLHIHVVWSPSLLFADSIISMIIYSCYIWISKLLLASVAEQATLSLTWSHIYENRFFHDVAQLLVARIFSGSLIVEYLVMSETGSAVTVSLQLLSFSSSNFFWRKFQK